jgi:hypothetical protein
MSATSGAETANSSRAPEYTPRFYLDSCYSILSALYNNVIHINEERTGKCLRQVEHICGHLWHRYSVTVNRVMVASEKLQPIGKSWYSKGGLTWTFTFFFFFGVFYHLEHTERQQKNSYWISKEYWPLQHTCTKISGFFNIICIF